MSKITFAVGDSRQNGKIWFDTNNLTLFLVASGRTHTAHPANGFDRAKLLACCLRVRNNVPVSNPAWHRSGAAYSLGSWAHVVATLLEGAGLTESVLGGSRE